MQLIYHIQPDPERKPSASQDKLSIDVSLGHLAISSYHNKQLVYLDLYTTDVNDPVLAIDQLSALLSDHPLLETSFEQLRVIYHTPESILVPGAFYKEDSKDHLLQWQVGDAGYYFPMKDYIKKTDIHLLYAVPEALHQIVTVHFPNATFAHAHVSSVLLENTGADPFIHIEVYPTEWICSFWNNGKLQLIRSLISNTEDDLTYMLLYICGQKNMDATQTCIQISGLIEKDDPKSVMLSTFFKSVEWKESDLSTNQPNHFFTAIIKQSLCEL